MLAIGVPANDATRPASSGQAGLLAVALQQQCHTWAAVEGAPEVPGYEIIGRLGAGSSGEVWLAEELETGRTLALKILHRHGAAGASAEFLQREIQMLAKLVHPNLVLLHNVVVTSDGRQGLATEWIDGWPLDEWLQRHPDLTLTRKLELFHGIVKGVAFLHDHGVIHRDLKPANLIVDAEGRAKIVDFGLARFYREDAATGTDGGSIGVSGTLHFMAPEQAANRDGARAMPVDVYALGLIFHRILTGNWLLPPGGTPVETLAMVLHPPPLALHGPARALPRDLQSILRQSLAPDPAHRYRHARDLGADLDRFAAKQPVAARKHTVVYLITTLLRRQARRSIIAACLVLAGLAAGGTIYHRHRQVVARNEANLRYAYTLTSFTLGELRDELRAAVPEEKDHPQTGGGGFPEAADVGIPVLPVDAAGELDLRYYHAQLADLRSATLEGQANYHTALTSIQKALDLFCQLALESPHDPKRLLDATQARLSFTRLLDRTERSEAAGREAQKTLLMLGRLAAMPGCDPALLPPLRCDALRLAARDAYRLGEPARAVALVREMLAAAGSLPTGLLVRPENEVAPRLALAVSDLATYAIAADSAGLQEARREIDRAIATCRAARERDPEIPALTRGLAYCLHAKARLSLHAGPLDEMRALMAEGAELLIGRTSPVRLSSFPLVRDYFATATAWAGALQEHPDANAEVADAALDLAQRFVTCLRSNGGATGDVMLLRARLFLHESQLACRFHGRGKAARPAARALRLLRPLQVQDPDRLHLALLTAVALHQVRGLAEFPHADWSEEDHGAHLNRLMKQLSDRSAELTPEQRREFLSLQ
jgi:tetratricopeptide (TPR) repeat protein